MEILTSLGICPEIIAVILGAVILFERIGKLIPDTATGVLGTVRKVSKFLGAYVENQKQMLKLIQSFLSLLGLGMQNARDSELKADGARKGELERRDKQDEIRDDAKRHREIDNSSGS